MSTCGLVNRERSLRCLREVFEDGLEVVGYGHRLERTNVGTAGVADGIAPSPRTRAGYHEAQQLAEHLATVASPEPTAEHRQVCPHVRDCHQLAQDVGTLQVAPLAGQVATRSGGARRGPLVSPCSEHDGPPWRRESSTGKRRHR